MNKPMPKHAHKFALSLDDDCLSMRVEFTENSYFWIASLGILSETERLQLSGLLEQVYAMATTGKDLSVNTAQNYFYKHYHALIDAYDIRHLHSKR